MTDFNSPSMAESNTKLIIESNTPVKETDYEIVSMFFENRKQSNGGDVVSFRPAAMECSEDSNSKKVKRFELVYQNIADKQRVLYKKFFSYGNYSLISSESGLKNTEFKLNKREMNAKNYLK